VTVQVWISDSHTDDSVQSETDGVTGTGGIAPLILNLRTASAPLQQAWAPEPLWVVWRLDKCLVPAGSRSETSPFCTTDCPQQAQQTEGDDSALQALYES
jgi:hypothetical protein